MDDARTIFILALIQHMLVELLLCAWYCSRPWGYLVRGKVNLLLLQALHWIWGNA